MAHATRELVTKLSKVSLWRVEAVDDPSQPAVPDRLLDLAEVAALADTTEFGLKIRVSKARKNGKPWPLPPVAPGYGRSYHYRFRERDVLQWLEKGANAPATIDSVFRIVNRGSAFLRDSKLPHDARGLLGFILAHDEEEMACALVELQITESDAVMRQMLVELAGRGYVEPQMGKEQRGQMLYLVRGSPDEAQQMAVMRRTVEEVLDTGRLILEHRVRPPRFVFEALGLDMDPLRRPVEEDPAYVALKAGTLDRAVVLSNIR